MNDIILFFSLTLGFNLLMFIPAFLFSTDKITDITYSLSFVISAITFYYINPYSEINLFIIIMISLWAFRLGSYLLYRITKIKKDSRFDGIRQDFFKFLTFWFFQAVSVFIIMLPCILVYQMKLVFSYYSIIGLFVWISGLAIESISDYQKFIFRKNTKDHKWIDSGLWRYSRHPNYLGEILLWFGFYLFLLPYLDLKLAVLGSISPIYVFIMIRYISGVPMLESRADSKWGRDRRYIEYKEKSGLIFPKI